MTKLFRELRRREVFRSIGLYIGGVWIVLQVADVVLPAFDAPEWVFKALLGVAVVGFPIAVVLAWHYDLTSSGIKVEADQADEVAVPRRGTADFVVVGVLLVALGISLFANFAPREPVTQADIEPLSVLIADFDNRTGESVFNGVVEQGLTLGIEASSFISAYDRATAERVLGDIGEQSVLDSAGARLVAAREGIGVVVGGALTPDGDRYQLDAELIDPAEGELLAEFRERASGKTEVLTAVANLARDLREELGDVTVDSAVEGEETFTTISVESMHDYVLAQRLARNGKDDEAIGLYEAAVEKDPQFGRAWSGLAVSADKLGKTEVAAEAWANAMRYLEGMTERERYRTEGVYFSVVARNSEKAIETYRTLVEKYPADDSGHNNLAFAYFLDLQFDKALEAGRRVVEIYPTKAMYHANHALYAMYAGDFAAATSAAAKTLELNPNYHKAYLPYAIAALSKGDVEAARMAYQQMASTGPRGASVASIGLADLMLWSGDAGTAEAILLEGMATDEENQNNRGLAVKKMMHAYAMWQQGRDAGDVAAQIDVALPMSSGMSQLVPAALLYIELGMPESAAEIASELGSRLEPQQRAYAKLINASLLLQDGQSIAAIEELQAALALADVWLVRFHRGVAYHAAGHYAEAVSEFNAARERLGEAYSLFLDDTPTFRYTAGLDEWLARAREEMMSGT